MGSTRIKQNLVRIQKFSYFLILDNLKVDPIIDHKSGYGDLIARRYQKLTDLDKIKGYYSSVGLVVKNNTRLLTNHSYTTPYLIRHNISL